MEGEFYTEVDASVLNPGISPMAMVSGDPEPPEGSTTSIVWIRWRYDNQNGDGGFTGISWFTGIEGNIISNRFDTEQQFKDHLVELGEGGPTYLNDMFASWDGNEKNKFITLASESNPALYGCLVFPYT